MKKSLFLQKKYMRFSIFSDYCEHANHIFKSLKILKFQKVLSNTVLLQLLQFSIYFYFNGQLPLQVKNIFIQNDSVNPYNSGGGKLLIILNINGTHFGTKSLKYNDPLTWSNFSSSIINSNFYNVGISKFKIVFLNNLLPENFYQE